MNKLHRMQHIRKMIEKKLADLAEICTPTPKGQRITGMPRGGVARNAAEDYVERKEKLSAEIQTLYRKLDRAWNDFERYCECRGCTDDEINLLKLHYYYNYTWKKVQQELQVHFPKKVWNKNKVFRVRRRAFEKIDPWYISKHR